MGENAWSKGGKRMIDYHLLSLSIAISFVVLYITECLFSAAVEVRNKLEKLQEELRGGGQKDHRNVSDGLSCKC